MERTKKTILPKEAVREQGQQLEGDIKQESLDERILFGPAKQELEVLGQFTECLTYQQASTETEVYVVRGLKTNLLGLPAITSLHLIERLCSTEARADIKDCFPKVFNGLGTLGEEYEN